MRIIVAFAFGVLLSYLWYHPEAVVGWKAQAELLLSE